MFLELVPQPPFFASRVCPVAMQFGLEHIAACLMLFLINNSKQNFIQYLVGPFSMYHSGRPAPLVYMYRYFFKHVYNVLKGLVNFVCFLRRYFFVPSRILVIN